MTDTTAPRTAAPDLARLRALIEAATPGPWEFLPKEAVGGMAIVPMDGPAVVPNAWGTYEPDAALIVEAVNALPALLDRAEAIEPLLALIRAAQQYLAVEDETAPVKMTGFEPWWRDYEARADAAVAATRTALAALPDSVRAVARKPE